MPMRLAIQPMASVCTECLRVLVAMRSSRLCKGRAQWLWRTVDTHKSRVQTPSHESQEVCSIDIVFLDPCVGGHIRLYPSWGAFCMPTWRAMGAFALENKAEDWKPHKASEQGSEGRRRRYLSAFLSITFASQGIFYERLCMLCW